MITNNARKQSSLRYKQKKETLKKIDVIRNEIKKEIEKGFDFADIEIGNLYTGLSTIVSPLIRIIYNFSERDQIKARSFAQLEVLLKCANECKGDNIDNIIEKYLDDYLFFDETYIRSQQSHPKFPHLKRLILNSFKNRLEVIITLLHGKGNDYNELVRSILSKEEAESLLGNDLEQVGKVLKFIEDESDILNIPLIARKDILKMLRISYKYAKERFHMRINEIYAV